MSLKLFITGTDTNVGKTHISIGLLKAFNQLNYQTIGLKPVATGCINKNGLLYSEDALALQDASSISLAYRYINPFRFAPPIAPHLAAKQAQLSLSTDTLIAKLNYAINYPADLHVIEGVGGWLVPLNAQQTMADFVIQCQLPVIVVIGIRLGCLNHALLTVQAIQHTSVPLIGWIANCTEANQANADELITTLKEWLPIPWLATIRHQECAANKLDPILIKKLSC